MLFHILRESFSKGSCPAHVKTKTIYRRQRCQICIVPQPSKITAVPPLLGLGEQGGETSWADRMATEAGLLNVSLSRVSGED